MAAIGRIGFVHVRGAATLVSACCAAFVLAQPARAAVSASAARVVVPPGAALALVPADLRPLAVRLRPRAAAATRLRRSPLAKAEVLAALVHTAVASKNADCWGYASVMAALGRHLGLELRLVVGSSGFSDYDTHTTVSLWLPAYGRWGIVDPTFGGTFTRGRDARPLDAIDLRQAILQGWDDEIVWHSLHAPPDSRPSAYYVNPVALFRYLAAYGWHDGAPRPLALPDSTLVKADALVVSQRALATAPPHARVAVGSPAATGPDAVPTELTLPPWYAPHEIWRGSVQLPATVAAPYTGAVVVWVGVPGVRVGSYDTAEVDGGSLSPIIANGTLALGGSGPAQVRIFAARVFPAARER